MGTLVSIDAEATDAQFERAFGWFHEIEARCSRFLESSELRQLKPGEPVPASSI
ncbi:MAG: ApbE family, partial [Acidobacteriota bacterium]